LVLVGDFPFRQWDYSLRSGCYLFCKVAHCVQIEQWLDTASVTQEMQQELS